MLIFWVFKRTVCCHHQIESQRASRVILFCAKVSSVSTLRSIHGWFRSSGKLNSPGALCLVLDEGRGLSCLKETLGLAQCTIRSINLQGIDQMDLQCRWFAFRAPGHRSLRLSGPVDSSASGSSVKYIQILKSQDHRGPKAKDPKCGSSFKVFRYFYWYYYYYCYYWVAE